MQVPRTIFREYDVRGLVATELSPEFARALGRAFGSAAWDRLGKAPVIAVGRDNRPSGGQFAEAVRQGIADAGGTAIDVGVFTNFTQDHLDYHGDMDRYWQAKEMLFAWPGLKAAAVNVDDAQGAVLAGRLRGADLDVWTLSRAGGAAPARLQARNVRSEAEGGLVFELVEAGGEPVTARTGLIGDYNVSNLLGVVAVYATLTVPQVILVESFLSFLGLGVQEPATSWGVLVNDGAADMEVAPWALLFPAGFLVFTLLCLNFLGDALRDALDPHGR